MSNRTVPAAAEGMPDYSKFTPAELEAEFMRLVSKLSPAAQTEYLAKLRSMVKEAEAGR